MTGKGSNPEELWITPCGFPEYQAQESLPVYDFFMIRVSHRAWVAAFGFVSVLALGTSAFLGREICSPMPQEKVSDISGLQAKLADAALREKSLREENARLKANLTEIDAFLEVSAFTVNSAAETKKEVPAPRAISAPPAPAAAVTAKTVTGHSLTKGPPLTLAERQISSRPARAPEKDLTVLQSYAPLPHIDAHIRSGNRRTITGTDVWVPLRWDGRNLVFLDARFARSTQDDLEGNFGLGLRRVIDKWDGIWGAYGYYDIRRTEYDNVFSQATLGTEWLADNWEARANAYVALSDKKSTTTTLPTRISFSGTGLVATGGTSTLTEVPLSGGDLELGVKIPFSKSLPLPDVSIYGGGYYFTGDDVETVRGGRVRLHSEITDWLQIGAEYRRDNVRDDEALAEVRFRYRFGDTSVKPNRKLYERLDDQPMRDVDIVTNGATTEETSTATVTNASTGLAQEIFFVDNSAAGGGTGTTENPFNTLSAALAVAGTNDIIYVRAGDGTSTGMSSGVTLNDNGQKLIGSGTDLTFGMLNLNVSGLAAPSSNYVLAAASTAPVLTNTAAASDGITIAANDVYVAGVTVDGATRDGIRIAAGAGQNWQNIEINDVTLRNNQNIGLSLITTGGGDITDPVLSNITSSHNLFDGIQFNSSGAGSLITGVSLTDSLLEDNARYGIYGIAQTTGDFGVFDISGTTARNNGEIGMYFQATSAGSEIASISLDDSIAEDNADTGIYINAASGGLISTANLSDLTIQDNGENGLYVHSSGAGSVITNLSLIDSLIDNNAGYGYYAYATGGSDIGTLLTSRSTVTESGANGYYVLTDNATSVITSHTLADSTISDNDDHGVQIYASAGQITTSTLSDVTAEDNRANGFSIGTNAATGQIGTLSLTGLRAIDNADTGAYLYSTSGIIGSLALSDSEFLDNGNFGAYVSATGATGRINALSISDILSRDNHNHGLYLETTTAAQIATASLSDLTIQDNDEYGLYITSNGANSLIGAVTFDDSVIERSANHGLYAYATGGGDFTSIAIADVESTDNGGLGYYIYTDNATGVIGSLSLTDSTATNNANAGFYVYANAGQITTVTLDDLTASGSGDNGFDIRTAGATGLIGFLSFTDSEATDNDDQGVNVYATGGADITSATLSGLTATDNGANGYYILTDNATSVIGNLSLTNSSAIDSANSGFSIYANAGQITTATLSDLTSRDNGDVGYNIQVNAATGLIGTLSLTDATSLDEAGQGLYLYATGGGDITTATISDLSVTNSGAIGIYVGANAAGSVITNLSLTDSSSTGNATHGIYINGLTGGVITSATLDNLTANDNRANGISIVTANASRINSLSLTDSVADGNFDYGIYLNAGSTSVLSAEVQGVSATNNYQYGVFVDDDSTGAYTVDFGGGALGSTGNNRIFGSLIQDIRVDLDNQQLKAENNWWGNAAGLQAAERTLDGASTIDSSPFLAADPGP
jgi:hypothetical protein